jgi:hypothetical protein
MIKGLLVHSSRVEDQSEQVGRNLASQRLVMEMDREKRPPNILMYNLYCFLGPAFPLASHGRRPAHLTVPISQQGRDCARNSVSWKINSSRIVTSTGNVDNTDVTGDSRVHAWVDKWMASIPENRTGGERDFAAESSPSTKQSSNAAQGPSLQD